MKKTADKTMDDAEKQAILAEIAGDRECYPRDRINAIRALHDVGLEVEPAEGDDI